MRSALAATCLGLAAATSVAHVFANGAYAGSVSQLASSGYMFYDNAGVRTDPFVLLKKLDINAVRLHIWVNLAR